MRSVSINSTFLWMVSVKTDEKQKTADVTVQKAAHRILLYGFTHSPSRSPSPPWVPFTCRPGRSGSGKCLAFTESTTWALVPSLCGRAHRPRCNHSSASHFLVPPWPLSLISPLSGWLCSIVCDLFFLSPVGQREAVPGPAALIRLCRWFWFSLDCHSLMSWDSNILARVFFTLRAVRREAGLWAQHSDISFPICRRHWGHTSP